MSRTSPLTALQIRLRPREIGLLTLMAERERRRPQDQAAALVGFALEEWAEKTGLAAPAAPEPFDEVEVETWPET